MDKGARDKVEDRVSELIAQAIQDDMNDMEPVSITREELHALERADRLKKRKKRLKYIGVAAAIVLVFAAIIHTAWSDVFQPVNADKDNKQVAKQKDDVLIIENEGQDADVISEPETFENWNEVKKYEKKHSELYLPAQKVRGYSFLKMSVEADENDEKTYEYTFKNKNKQSFHITQLSGNIDEQALLVGFSKKPISVGNKAVYFKENQKELVALFVINGSTITLSGELNKDQIMEIISELK